MVHIRNEVGVARVQFGREERPFRGQPEVVARLAVPTRRPEITHPPVPRGHLCTGQETGEIHRFNCSIRTHTHTHTQSFYGKGVLTREKETEKERAEFTEAKTLNPPDFWFVCQLQKTLQVLSCF